jgi:hypothetical protein
MAYLEPAPIAFTLFQPTHDALRLEKAIRFHNYMHLVARTRINKLIHYDDKPIANPHRTAPHRTKMRSNDQHCQPQQRSAQ